VEGWMHKWALCNHYAPKEEHNVHTAFYGFLQSLIFKQVDSYMFFFSFLDQVPDLLTFVLSPSKLIAK
jgi:hypothetical protein